METSNVLKNERGQLAIVLPLSLTIAIAGTLMWGYLQLLYVQSSANIMGANAGSVVRMLHARIQTHLKGPYISCRDPHHEDFPDEPDQIFSVFRNFKLGAPTAAVAHPKALVWAYEADPIPAEGIPCLLGDKSIGQDPGELSALQSVSILVARIGQSDPIAMSSQIEVTVKIKTKSNSGNSSQAAKTSALSHQYMLRAGRLANYGLVLLPNDRADRTSPQISVDPGSTATVEFLSSVFAPSLTLDSLSSIVGFSSSPKVSFNQPVDIRKAEIKYDTEPSPFLGTTTFHKVFRQGINLNALGNYYPGAPNFPNYTSTIYPSDPSPQLNSNVTISGKPAFQVSLPIAPIPMVDPSPIQNGWDPMVFSQPLDYTYVYNSWPDASIAPTYYPIPDLQWEAVRHEFDAVYSYKEEWAPANGTFWKGAIPNGSYSCNSPQSPEICYNGWHAKSLNTLPTTSTEVVPSLRVTCNKDLERVPAFVYQRLGHPGYGSPSPDAWFQDENSQHFYYSRLTIEFDRDCTEYGCDNVFCGLIATPVLQIKTPPNAPANQVYAIYGNIVTSRIEITGGGRVVFANPMDNTPIQGVDFGSKIETAGQSTTNLFAQFQRLASSTGLNFFTPFYFNYAYSDASLVNPVPRTSVFPASSASYMQPCMTDPRNEANDGVMMDNTTYCPLSNTNPPTIDSVAWGKDTIAMTISVSQ